MVVGMASETPRTIEHAFRCAVVAAFLLLGLFSPVGARSANPKRPHSSQRGGIRTPQKKQAVQSFVLVGAGDIASCKEPEGARATAKLVEKIPGTVFAAGDLA